MPLTYTKQELISLRLNPLSSQNPPRSVCDTIRGLGLSRNSHPDTHEANRTSSEQAFIPFVETSAINPSIVYYSQNHSQSSTAVPTSQSIVSSFEDSSTANQCVPSASSPDRH